MALVPPMRAAFATGGGSVPEFLAWGALEGPRSSVTHVAPFRMLSILEPTRGFRLFLKDDSFVIFLDDLKFFFLYYKLILSLINLSITFNFFIYILFRQEIN